MTNILTTNKYQSIPWQQMMQRNITSLATLCDYLALNPSDVIQTLDPAELPLQHTLTTTPLNALHDALAQFPLRVPLPFAARMRKGDIHDPLLRQVLARPIEQAMVPGFGTDPLHEAHASPVPGLLHKYQTRVLFIMAGACPVNCRFCFRRHFPYQAHILTDAHWQHALAYVQAHPDIDEVIFSGGEPLLLPDDKLSEKIADLAQLPQLARIRFHTRMPIMLPSRINTELLAWITQYKDRLQMIFVLHCNHPQEIDDTVMAALQTLHRAQVCLLNQHVLLRGVNDDVDTLRRLSLLLFRCGVLPYYIHQLDPIMGSAHFAVTDEKAIQLMQQLNATLPGYLVPKLVREVADMPNKIPIG